jgi:hypothetical protein
MSILSRMEGRMKRSWSRTPVLCLALLGMTLPATAQTQDDKDKWNVQQFIPPIIPLPPKAQVEGSRIEEMRTYSDPANVTNPQAPPSAGGLRLTLPLR